MKGTTQFPYVFHNYLGMFLSSTSKLKEATKKYVLLRISVLLRRLLHSQYSTGRLPTYKLVADGMDGEEEKKELL